MVYVDFILDTDVNEQEYQNALEFLSFVERLGFPVYELELPYVYSKSKSFSLTVSEVKREIEKFINEKPVKFIHFEIGETTE